MLFNSINFIYFFLCVITIFWAINFCIKEEKKIINLQNLLLFISSLIFYSFWNIKFLSLLFFVILVGFLFGIQIKNKIISNKKLAKKIMIFGVSIHLMTLVIFKYYNFFISEFYNLTGISNDNFFKIVLPIGISFYIFHGVSYLVDIYNKKVIPTINFINYGLFISYFPLLVSGPIERATSLLPQFKHKKIISFEKIISGITLICWGYFKKVVVADNVSVFADLSFNSISNSDVSGPFLLIGILFFSIQIYCDFSGYTDIAIGVSRLFGIELLQNFNFPYFSKNLKEFWKRWHISLTSFFRDYLYIPLGGSRNGYKKTIYNIFLVFIISGFWHGANWTFIIWGLIHFIFYIPYTIKKITPFIKNFENRLGILNYLLTFIIVTFAWVFFRADSFSGSVDIIFSIFDIPALNYGYLLYDFTIILIFGFFEFKSYQNFKFLTNNLLLILILILFLRAAQQNSFIYFQF